LRDFHDMTRHMTRRARAFAGRFLGSTSGNTAMIFGLLSVTVIMAGGAAIDMARAVSMKTRLSSALDAAALAVGTQLNTSEAELEEMAQKYFDANYPESALGTTEAVDVHKNGDKIELSVTGHVETTLLKIMNINGFDLTVDNEVTRSANNIEVALVLDITGSMCIPDCTKLNNLKVAAKDMVDMIVQDVQTPYYTKMAVVPYSSMVNVGSYATSVRGAITPAQTISGVQWQNTTYGTKTITAVTKANPAVFTAASHGLVAGDKIWLSGITGMTQLNDKPYIVRSTGLTTNSFQLQRWNSGSYTTLDTSSGYSTFSAGTNAIKKCLVNTNTVNGCELQVTATAHGFSNGARVVISGVSASTGGSTAANAINNSTTDNNDADDTDNKRGTWAVSNVATNTFTIPAYMPSGTTPTWVYNAAGSLYCTVIGCEYNRFTGYSKTKVFQISTCVSERTGAEAYTDAAPTTALLGRVYPASPGASDNSKRADADNPCISATITPLSTDKTALKTQIQNMTASGSTAGHIGTAWGWYMIAPTFAYLWPEASRPAAYGTDHLYKIMILMTDGEFNTFYCNNVISQDSPHIANYSDRDDHKNCNGPNGSPFTQAQTLCTNMKAEGKDVIVYTVGFDIGDDANAQSIMANCATDSDHAYYPETGAELKQSFQHIAQEISQLRLSQ
jgi:Flp pilus assembly protein TadG